MADGCYHPLNVLKPVSDDLWIVDGPLIPFGGLGIQFPFPTRMTIVRLQEGLFIHSPTALSPSLKDAVCNLGPPRWIVGPSTIHYWWIPEWRNAFPEAQVFLAPGIMERAKGRLSGSHVLLDHDAGWPWSEELATWVIAGSGVTEVDFFHHASRTLLLTDLIENFEADKIGSQWMRWIARMGGVLAPHGGMPRDMRIVYWRQRSRLRAVIERMIELEPRRIVLAHGRWHQDNGTEHLRRAFRWLLPKRVAGAH